MLPRSNFLHAVIHLLPRTLIRIALAGLLATHSKDNRNKHLNLPLFRSPGHFSSPVGGLAIAVFQGLSFYLERYDEIVREVMIPHTGERYLGKKPHRCRFCGKSEKEEKFSKIAHAISELVGNKVLFTYEECDKCNERFSHVEDDFGKWTLLERSLGQVSGKKGVPSTKTRAKTSRIDHSSQGLKIRQTSGDEIATFDISKMQLTGGMLTQPYRPRAVYKSLVKMALTLMPESELSSFKIAMNWLKEEGIEKGAVDDGMNYVCLKSFTSGPLPHAFPIATILRRKDDVTDCPYSVFFLAYGNTTLQIFIPSERNLVLDGTTFSIPPHPAPHQLRPRKPYDKTQFKVIHLDGIDRIKDDQQNFNMHVGQYRKLSKEEIDLLKNK